MGSGRGSLSQARLLPLQPSSHRQRAGSIDGPLKDVPSPARLGTADERRRSRDRGSAFPDRMDKVELDIFHREPAADRLAV